MSGKLASPLIGIAPPGEDSGNGIPAPNGAQGECVRIWGGGLTDDDAMPRDRG